MEQKPILEVKNLQISFQLNFGVNHVIRDISFHLDKGETLAIVGESGSGKIRYHEVYFGVD
jgi:ABC-type glutathione transport system ATPase component